MAHPAHAAAPPMIFLEGSSYSLAGWRTWLRRADIIRHGSVAGTF